MAKNVTKEMIERFINDQCDEVEAMIVARYLKKNKEVLRDHLPDEAFDMPENTEVASNKRQERTWEKIERAKNDQNRVLYIKKGLAAAVTLGIFFFGMYFFYDAGPKEKLRLAVKNNPSSGVHTINNTNKGKTIVLPDGTEVLLEAGADIEYAVAFKKHRHIVLTGKAFFKVAKDSVHPFTVTAAGINITALGTAFWITENTKEQIVDVHLVEGKVVVHSGEKQLAMQRVYLLPGQQLLIDKKRRLAYRSDDDKQKHNDDLKPNATTDSQISQRGMASGNTVWGNKAYSFSYEPLRRVFDRIEKRYQVIIELENDEIARYRFTGKIMYSDSLDVLLDQLCRINGLQYNRTGKKIKVQQK